MGYEFKYIYHPRKESGYDTEVKEEKTVKVGKPFDDTPLEKLAAAIMAQLARRDIWVVDVEVVELVRREISFKECKDGRGIMLKNRRYSFNESAQMVAEDVVEETPSFQEATGGLLGTMPNVQPHQLVAQTNVIDNLYSNPNAAVPVQKQTSQQLAAPINQNRSLYRVIFDPLQWTNEARQMKLKFTQDREYTVHQIVPHPTGRLDQQKIAVTDDTGRAIIVDEKYFTTAGRGLLADEQLNFSGSGGSPNRARRPKLSYEDQMVMDAPDPNSGSQFRSDFPVDDGNIPADLLAVPDIRAR